MGAIDRNGKMYVELEARGMAKQDMVYRGHKWFYLITRDESGTAHDRVVVSLWFRIGRSEAMQVASWVAHRDRDHLRTARFKAGRFLARPAEGE